MLCEFNFPVYMAIPTRIISSMNRWKKFRALPISQRRLLLRAWVEVLQTRMGLWLLPFSWHAARIVCTQPVAIRTSEITAENIAWAVVIAARYMPRATCLTQALAAKRMLNAEGISSQIRLACGVDNNGDAGAHAWLECNEKVLLGGVKPEGLVALPALKI